MNRVTLIANLVRDPEMGQTTSGMATCKFTVACNNGKDKDGNATQPAQTAPAPVAETTPVASEETSNEDIPF